MDITYLKADDDTTISDIPADQIYSGSLNNSGETLTLRDNSTNIIDTANNNSGPGMQVAALQLT
ncbi:MAG: hypothetical protein IPN96_07865 [Anaerolineales bacterium]|nr:hypothetical protein [Anaerolineales bacterium]